jgi:hypothetical protein
LEGSLASQFDAASRSIFRRNSRQHAIYRGAVYTFPKQVLRISGCLKESALFGGADEAIAADYDSVSQTL